MKISTLILAGTLGVFATAAYAQMPMGSGPGMSPAPSGSSGMGMQQGGTSGIGGGTASTQMEKPMMKKKMMKKKMMKKKKMM